MKLTKKASDILLATIAGIIMIFIYFLLCSGKSINKNSSCDVSCSESVQSVTSDTFGGTDLTEDSSYVYDFHSNESCFQESHVENCKELKLSKYADYISDGIYTLTVTRQSIIGGLSVPITTVTVHGSNYIDILEYEAHNIITHTFINSDGAYMFDELTGSCHIYPKDVLSAQTVDFTDAVFIESGFTASGADFYNYERYTFPTGEIVDFLFDDDYLCGLKLHDGTDYELIKIEISDYTENCDSFLDNTVSFIDHR